jgi:predicted ArsR family transcriptional regulator
VAERNALQVQARALGDPTRHGIFRYIADAQRPVGVAELTQHCGLNHNAIRQHLAKLVDAGLVLESTAAPTGRGRPRLEFELDPNCDSRWGVAGPYERLSVLLAEIVRTGDPAEVVGQRAGRQVRARTGRRAADPVVELAAEMARHGFEPEVRRSDERFTLVLTNCPFASAVMADQSTVCTLHLGLARGAAEALGGIEVDRLVPHDPRQANCQLDCTLVDDTGSTAGAA